MNKNELNINEWFEQFEHRFEKAVPNIVAETATEYFKDRFKKSNEDWDKKKWQKLNPRYAAKKTAGKGRILTRISALSGSIRPTTVSPQKVTITGGDQNVKYARIHNEGLRVTGSFKVKRFTNSNFMGTGRAVEIKAHTRNVNFKMPKRQFMGHSRYLNAIMRTRLIKVFE